MVNFPVIFLFIKETLFSTTIYGVYFPAISFFLKKTVFLFSTSFPDYPLFLK